MQRRQSISQTQVAQLCFSNSAVCVLILRILRILLIPLILLTLSIGTRAPPAGQDDDLYWMNQLHTILVGKGFYPPDEEIEALIFAEGTQSALMYFQAAEGIPETGASTALAEPTNAYVR